jgi:hypothetical protein
MNSVLHDLMASYACQTDEDYQHALKEIIQEIALLGLWRAKFFEHAAFYGGTALKILYGLDRFSEDLDFMLLAKKTDFTFSTYQKNLEKELSSFGLSVQMTEKPKARRSRIQSAFLKANTKQHMFLVNVPPIITSRVQQAQTLKIKLEIDIESCQGFTVESHAVLKPMPFWVRTLSLSSLFSGKMHAVLCRTWGTRVKGRD